MLVLAKKNRFFREIASHLVWIDGPVDSSGLCKDGERLCVTCEDCRGEDFSGLDLRGAEFFGVHLRGCDFSNALLDGATFSGCDLSKVNLTGATFCKAAFEDCSFLDANLSDADFSEATLKDVDFRRTGAVAAWLGDKFVFVSRTNASVGADFASHEYWLSLTRNTIKAADLFGDGLHGVLGATCEWWDDYGAVLLSMIRSCGSSLQIKACRA